jgi:hypothetical protein
MRKERRSVGEQPVMATVQHVRIGDRHLIGSEQIAQRRAALPLAMQPPLAPRGDQSIRRKHEHHQIPARSLARPR